MKNYGDGIHSGRSSRSLRRVALGAVCLAAIGYAASAQAQDATPNAYPTTLGEVIVTAQKRSENLQQTPIAITAITADQISGGAGIAGPQQLQFSVPSMTFGQNAGFAYISLRGIGTDASGTAGQSAVGSYVDGVYNGDLIAGSTPTFGLSRIEVLRGPQGTLYGRNTTGGVINYITTLPDFEPGAYVSLSYGKYAAGSSDVAITGPLVADKLAGRLTAHFSEHDGYRHNLALGTDEDADEIRSVRGTLLFEPTSDLSVVLRADSSSGVNSNPYQLISQQTLSGGVSEMTPLGVFSLPAATLAFIPGLLSPADLASLGGGSIASRFGLLQPGPAAPDPNNSLDFSNSVPSRTETETSGGSLTVDWDVGGINLKSISAYRYARLKFTLDTGGYGTPLVQYGPALQETDRFTQEFNASGKSFEGRLDWLLGAFYLKEDTDFGATLWLPSFGQTVIAGVSFAGVSPYPYALNLSQPYLTGLFSAIPSVYSSVTVPSPNYVGGALLTPFVSVPDTAFLGFLTRQQSQSSALFGQATYQVTDALRVTGGLRYTEDKIDAERSVHSNLLYTLSGFTGSTSNAVAAGLLCDRVKESNSWSATTGTVGVDYDLAQGVMTYAKYSRGYKSGGFNMAECAGNFDPEYLTDYEGGFKSVFANGQILLNVAGYYYDYKDIQFTTYTQNTSSIKNAGSAKALGVEVEYVIQPRAVQGLQIDGSFSYEKSEYGPGCFGDPANQNGGASVPPGPDGKPAKVCPAVAPGGVPVGPSAQIDGNALIRAPQWKASFGAQYTRELGDGSSVIIRGDAAYTDTIYNDIFNGKVPGEAATTQPSYWVVNARLAWTSASGKYRTELYGNNLTDSLYSTNRVAYNTPPTVNTVVGQFAPPKTFGVRLVMKFGSEAP